ncbi:hypothetical protein CBR_g29422 [Chara braunii]|uniref:Uncharacterized protein n=1 Tax=Chara braunii TaxID=69332 RepID=A0A388LAQ0_CHABU|nr:hypothetical protein CBR_g29422 [Chara braunii]|eukprot:GBG79272.1 hypothetical protein CBR_g29422 [Chara braunii]
MSCVAHQVPRRENRRSNASVLRNSDTMGPPSSQSPMMRSRRGSVASACSVLQEKGGSCSPLVSKKGRNSTPVRSGNSSPAGNNCAAPRQATRCSSQRQEMRQGKNGSTKHGTNSNSHVMSTRGKEKQVPDSHHANNNSVSDESDSAQDSEEFTQLITPDAALSYADLLLQDKTTRKLLLDEPDVAEVLDTALREEVYNAFYQAMQVHQGSISVAIKEQELDELELRNGLVLQVLKVYLKLSMYRDVATLENIQNSKGNKSSVAWEGFTPVCNEILDLSLQCAMRFLRKCWNCPEGLCQSFVDLSIDLVILRMVVKVGEELVQEEACRLSLRLVPGKCVQGWKQRKRTKPGCKVALGHRPEAANQERMAVQDHVHQCILSRRRRAAK